MSPKKKLRVKDSKMNLYLGIIIHFSSLTRWSHRDATFPITNGKKIKLQNQNCYLLQKTHVVVLQKVYPHQITDKWVPCPTPSPPPSPDERPSPVAPAPNPLTEKNLAILLSLTNQCNVILLFVSVCKFNAHYLKVCALLKSLNSDVFFGSFCMQF